MGINNNFIDKYTAIISQAINNIVIIIKFRFDFIDNKNFFILISIIFIIITEFKTVNDLPIILALHVKFFILFNFEV